MNYFYLKIFGLILFIFAVSYWNTYCSSFIESFSSNKSSRAIVLLGDSILKNNSYVPDGKAVDNIIEERVLKNDKNIELYSLAENNSKIVDVYSQINKIHHTRMDLCQIVLLDVYYPTCNQFAQDKPIHEEWNSLIATYARENSLGLLQISYVVTDNGDFTLGIEPSEKGGEKIAQSIIDYN